jgi:hypothetical protein
LRLAEKMLLQLVSPFVPQQYINHGTFGLKGHVCCFPQAVSEVFTVLPRLPKNVKIIKLVRRVTSTVGGPTTERSFQVRRDVVMRALMWLKAHNRLYRDVLVAPERLAWMNGQDEADISNELGEINDWNKDSQKDCDDGDEDCDMDPAKGSDLNVSISEPTMLGIRCFLISSLHFYPKFNF